MGIDLKSFQENGLQNDEKDVWILVNEYGRVLCYDYLALPSSNTQFDDCIVKAYNCIGIGDRFIVTLVID